MYCKNLIGACFDKCNTKRYKNQHNYCETHDNFNHVGATQGEDATQEDINPVAHNTYRPFSFRRDDFSPVRDIGRQTKSTDATPGANRSNIHGNRQQQTTAESTPKGKQSKIHFLWRRGIDILHKPDHGAYF